MAVKQFYTSGEIAETLCLSKFGVRKRLISIQAIETKVVNHNETKVYAFDSLPKDYQEKLSAPAVVTPAAPAALTTTEPLPAAPASLEVPTSLLPAKKTKHLVTLATQVPDKAKKIALAKYDLLQQIEKYCELHDDLNKTNAAREFINSYNSGLVLQEIYGMIGECCLSTVYKWKKDLGKSSDYIRLVPGWFGHGAGTKIPEALKDMILSSLLTPNKVKIGTAYRLIKFSLIKKGIELSVSEDTVRRFVNEFREKHEDIWIFMREGKKTLNDTMLPYIKRDASMLEVGECLVADGHTLNIMAINPWTGKAARPTLIAYQDWKSGCLVGYEIMFDADTQAVCSALRNAIIYLGKVPEFAYQDNGREFKNKFFNGHPDFEETGMSGLFARIGVKAVYAQPYNAQAKIIERFFKEFGDTFERLMPSFSGSSIEDRPAQFMRNEKFHKKNYTGEVPMVQDLMAAIEKWREFQRSQPCANVPGKTIGQVFDAGRGSGVDESELDDLMMAEKKTKVYRNGIKFFGSEYWNDELYSLMRDSDTTIKYSLFDLSKIKVYDDEGRFVCEAKRVVAIHPLAAHKGTAQDREALKVQIKQKKHLEKITRQASQGIIEIQRHNQLIEYTEPAAAATEESQNIIKMPVAKEQPESHQITKRPIFKSETEKEEWEIEQRRQAL